MFNLLSSVLYWIIKSFVEGVLQLIGPMIFLVLGIAWTFELVKNSVAWQTFVFCIFFTVAADLRSFFKIKCKEWFVD